MAGYGHTKALDPPPTASSKVMRPCPDCPPTLPELVLITTHVSYQGARVLMKAEGHEGDSDADKRWPG